QPVSAILEAAQEHKADVIGMSGLLVKSTVIMKENLEELNARGLGSRFPVILGGAALTRAYVEQDLHEIYEGEVRYARDAFEGLRLMDALIAVKRGVPGVALPPLKQRRVAPRSALLDVREPEAAVRSDVAADNPVPEPPFLGTRVVKGIQLKEYADWLDEQALFKGQWGLKSPESIAVEGRPRLRGWLDRLHTDRLLEAAVVYGYFPCVSKGDDLIILDEDGSERSRFTFPRQSRGRRLCLADYFRPEDSGETDVVALQVVTMGSKIGEATAKLFEADAYRDYMELHGLSVQLAEALAEYWHARVRTELGIDGSDPASVDGMFRTEYQGCRYSLGYPACPELADRAKIADLLRPERIGVHLSEEFQLDPEQSTDALVVHHPEANYFNAGGRR
ncbi:vitamin B12 dependent-methionine synthase activation domain-containing protein, partial [Streptomyces lavendulae]|uniref:vitamin B12 dependent-methionine synthase activation domain-containing protein n=1 Tax=Streptomyces lavendulae TaxID=1914 RepID=UPI003818BD6A